MNAGTISNGRFLISTAKMRGCCRQKSWTKDMADEKYYQSSGKKKPPSRRLAFAQQKL